MTAEDNDDRRRRSSARPKHRGSVVLRQPDVDRLLRGEVVYVEHGGERRQLDGADLTFMDLQRLRRGERLTVLTYGTDGAAPTDVQGPQPE